MGLLIAEYRRKILGERVLYLCPTKQLAYQVGKKSVEYSIPAKVLVGSKREFNRSEVISYRSASAIAISTYSGLFNTNPEFNDAQTIILDDSHGGESYISSLWSITVNREENPDIYPNLVSVFEKDIPTLSILYNSSRPRNLPKPEKIPFAIFYNNNSKIKEIFDSSLKPEMSNYYSWQFVREGLHACHAYISWDQVLIRPYIPPTLTHKPFADANQHIYMSATMGSGGELERITGISQIMRVTTPRIYLKHGIGRRLFLFPDLVKDVTKYESWLVKLINSSERTLALCPTGATLKSLKELLQQSEDPVQILGATDIENSMGPFSNSKSVILALANR